MFFEVNPAQVIVKMASVFGSDERFVTLNKKEFHELLDEKDS